MLCKTRLCSHFELPRRKLFLLLLLLLFGKLVRRRRWRRRRRRRISNRRVRCPVHRCVAALLLCLVHFFGFYFCLNDTFAFFFTKNLKYSELCCLFLHLIIYTELSLADFSLNLQSILESYFVFILHCAPLHVHHLFAVRTAVPRGQTAVSTSSNTAPRSLSVFIFQDTSLPTPQLTFPILFTLIFPNPFLY